LRKEIEELKKKVQWVKLPGYTKEAGPHGLRHHGSDPQGLEDGEKATLLQNALDLLEAGHRTARQARHKYLTGYSISTSAPTPLNGLKNKMADVSKPASARFHVKDVDLVVRCESCTWESASR